MLSIFGVTFFPVLASAAAIIVGHLARKKVKESGGDGKGYANAGIAIGWLTIVFCVVGGALFAGFWLWASTFPATTVGP